jgi:hypothetical protein
VGCAVSIRWTFLALPALTAAAFVSGAPATAKVLQWTCAYPKVSNANGVTGDQELAFTFTVDDVTGKAAVIGGAVRSNVEIFAGTGSITFLERLPSGAVQITSIDSSGSSVHSRHRLIGGQLLPSQSYGRCVSQK